ncbi:hypothetical protein ABKA04_009871 [Annulohypoxylon sp. FPYF3050]
MNLEGSDALKFGGGNTRIDPAVAAALPRGCLVLSTESHGISFWASTGRVNVQSENGTDLFFFIKVISGDTGRKMVESEYESMNEIYKVMPVFAPKPIAFGSYQTIPNTHFYLCEFHKLLDDMPNPHKFTKNLAELHQNSKSPTGKFGFHLPTYSGILPQWTEWEDSWEVFFTHNLRMALNLEIKVRGHDPELDVLVPAIFDKVIPRLLRPLESEGRSVKPCLVHGDLWYANSGIDADTGDSIIFDACCFYAHNESEYLQAYHDYVKISAPEEDYDGRLDLYKL